MLIMHYKAFISVILEDINVINHKSYHTLLNLYNLKKLFDFYFINILITKLRLFASR